MTIRFQADADLNHDIVTGVLRREPAIDFQSALEADLEGRADPEVLAIASRFGRLLISHDRRTMPRYFASFVETQTSAGLLIVPQDLPLQTVIETLILIWAATDENEWVNRIVYLPL